MFRLSFAASFCVAAFVEGSGSPASPIADQPSLYHLSLRNDAHAVQSPHLPDDVIVEERISSRSLSETNSSAPCDPEDVNLLDYPQWEAEVGYWIGEYSFYKHDGKPFASEAWNYPYDTYKGFITGNVKGNAYRQRNVFVYSPQTQERCTSTSDNVVGEGNCSVNGNTKVFFADQSATTCSTNPELGGDIEGSYEEVFYTTTELVGRNNTVLYQVWLDKDAFNLDEDQIFQSQLTTITHTSTGEVRRTRTAQEFELIPAGVPARASFYRERKVTREVFYLELAKGMSENGVLESDMCAWKNDQMGRPVSSGYEPGLEGCKKHLEQSFEL